MVDIVSSNNVVLHCLNKLFKNIHLAGNSSEAFKARLTKFRAFCESKEWLKIVTRNKSYGQI